MTLKGPPYGEGVGGPASGAVWYEGPPPLSLPRMSPRPMGPTASVLHTPRCGPSSLDSGWVALLLEQLHKTPAAAERGAPLAGAPRTPYPTNTTTTTTTSSSRGFLLRVLADEIMPQFLADPSVQQLASVLLQQQSPAAFEQALESEVAKLERLMGPPLHQGGPPSLSSSGGPLSARGWSASPSPPLGGPRAPPDEDGGPMGPLSSLTGTQAGTPRDRRASPPSSRRVIRGGGPPRLQEGAPPEPHEEFVTPVGAADLSPLLLGSPEAADLEPESQGGNEGLKGGPPQTQQAWEGGPPSLGGPHLTSSRDSPMRRAEANVPPLPPGGPPGKESEEDTSLLAAVRAARCVFMRERE
ncbi:hypothetical protein ACSSS7_005625 [Eimeria intestinalis]